MTETPLPNLKVAFFRPGPAKFVPKRQRKAKRNPKRKYRVLGPTEFYEASPKTLPGMEVQVTYRAQ